MADNIVSIRKRETKKIAKENWILPSLPFLRCDTCSMVVMDVASDGSLRP